jgi:hypothetical protein
MQKNSALTLIGSWRPSLPSPNIKIQRVGPHISLFCAFSELPPLIWNVRWNGTMGFSSLCP